MRGGEGEKRRDGEDESREKRGGEGGGREGRKGREEGRGGDVDENENVVGERTFLSKALLSVLRMISQLVLLSPNLSCKKDSVKTATIAAKDCVIVENYQAVSGDLRELY